MFYINTDITDQMKGFSKFAQQDDVNHAMDEILLICRKSIVKIGPRDVLDQIKFAAKGTKFNQDYLMACKIEKLLDEQRHKAKRKSEIIEDSVNDAIFGLKEIIKSGNPAVIKNYVEAVRLDLKQIESVL